MLQQNHFELFGLQPAFTIDQEGIAARYRDLQRVVHPDKFANATDQERLLSVQQAALINEAYQTLKSPLSRARYLLELQGITLNDNDTSMDPMFLMEQMELREALVEVRDKPDPFAALMALRDTFEGKEKGFFDDLNAAFSDGGTDALEGARDTVRKLQFMEKLLHELEELEDELV